MNRGWWRSGDFWVGVVCWTVALLIAGQVIR